jgi:5-methylcytosine-specific restriction endonuclease McrA
MTVGDGRRGGIRKMPPPLSEMPRPSRKILLAKRLTTVFSSVAVKGDGKGTGKGKGKGKKEQVNRAYIKKSNIPKALREQVWLTYVGPSFQRKCYIPWCKNTMNVFDFHVGHDNPESRGGATEIANLRPICARCNLSMGKTYTIQQWCGLSSPTAKRTWFGFFTHCFSSVIHNKKHL